MLPFPVLFLVIALKGHLATEEISEQDLSNSIEIGASREGYDRVGLRCGAEKMMVQLETTGDFRGVIYTQGSFHSRQPECFLDPVRGTTFDMAIPFNDCQTEKQGDKYTNTVVVQHDDELLMPGDAAFVLECDFSTPRNLTVTAEYRGTESYGKPRSRISLVNADPGRGRGRGRDRDRDRAKRAAAHAASETDEVVLRPSSTRPTNDEL